MDNIIFIAVYVLIGLITYGYFLYITKNNEDMNRKFKIKIFIVSLLASPLMILFELFLLLLNRYDD